MRLRLCGMVLGLMACTSSNDPHRLLLTLESTRQEYKVGDKISALLSNVTTRTVAYSSCAFLERHTDIGWTIAPELADVGCDASSFSLPPKESITIEYAPAKPVSTGTYRLRLSASDSDEPNASGSSNRVASNSFSIVE
jgi:hypothetical protein